MLLDYDNRPDPADCAEDPEPCTAKVHNRDGYTCTCCPECDDGVVVDAGPMERDTGHYPAACSARCGWTN